MVRKTLGESVDPLFEQGDSESVGVAVRDDEAVVQELVEVGLVVDGTTLLHFLDDVFGESRS